ncbi:MAG: hypothetical protein K5839_01115 [Treponemataceae bacterium]|nr:hypothetical protein [Treponemataceae bacterium]
MTVIATLLAVALVFGCAAMTLVGNTYYSEDGSITYVFGTDGVLTTTSTTTVLGVTGSISDECQYTVSGNTLSIIEEDGDTTTTTNYTVSTAKKSGRACLEILDSDGNVVNTLYYSKAE